MGAPGTLYAKSMQWRGLEGRENGRSKVPDAVTISPNRKTITFDERTFVMDEFRVVTTHGGRAVPPESIVPTWVTGSLCALTAQGPYG